MEKTVFGEQGGQVETYSLAECTHRDERGWVMFPWERKGVEIDPKTFHLVHTLPGVTRGNHSHPRAAEWLCVIEGEALLRWRPPSGDTQELHLEAQSKCVKIRPGVAHAVTNIGSGVMLLMAAREMDPAGDLSVPDKVV